MKKKIIIYTAENKYFVIADGYMNGSIETVISINDPTAQEYKEEFLNGYIRDETYAYENLSRRWNQQEGQYIPDAVSGNGRGSRGTVELDKRSESNVDRSANTRKSLSNDEGEKGEGYSRKDITDVDAGLRINDHSLLVECEKGDYSYKLVIYDNTFEKSR